MGDLTAEELATLQAIADDFQEPILVTGSAARGTRRGIGTGLPLGRQRSDLDLAIPAGPCGGLMEEALMEAFRQEIDARHGILRFFPPAGPDELVIVPRIRTDQEPR